MAFAFMSGKAAALVGIFSNHLTLTLNPFDSMPARIDASLVIIECSRNDFRSRSIMTLHKDEIRIWRVLDCRRDPRWFKLQLTRGRKL